MWSSSHPARGKPSGKLSPGNAPTTREREREWETGEREGGRGEVLHTGEAENGSSKVHQFQNLFHFIFKTSGPRQRKRYESVLHAGTTLFRRAQSERQCRDMQDFLALLEALLRMMMVTFVQHVDPKRDISTMTGYYKTWYDGSQRMLIFLVTLSFNLLLACWPHLKLFVSFTSGMSGVQVTRQWFYTLCACDPLI